MRRHTIAAALLFCLLPFPLKTAAQDLNPTVEVSRQYRGSLLDSEKPSVPMAMPDSVLRFDLEFDYSVFDNPFKGSYEFRPFLMDMDLSPAYSGEKSLYLRAGAGYTLHPELDFTWTPVRGRKFRMSLYARHRSYIGKYRSVGPVLTGNVPVFTSDGGRYSGHDMVTEAGADGTLDWDKGVFSFRAGYVGTALRDTTVRRGYDGVAVNLGVSSKENIGSHVIYDVDVSYMFAEDKFTAPACGKGYMSGHDFSFGASAGSSFKTGHSVLVDAGVDYAHYGGAISAGAGDVTLIPRYLYSKGRWDVNLGVKLAVLFRGGGDGTSISGDNMPGQIVYPDIRVSLNAIRNHLDIYLAIGGGTDMNRYSSLLMENRHVTPVYNSGMGTPLLGSTVERVSAAVGLKGNIASRFSYDISTGYRNFSAIPLPAVCALPGGYAAGIGYSPMQMFFAGLDFSWTSQDVRLGGRLDYRATDLSGRDAAVVAPAAFSGRIEAEYNWKERIYVGADCGFSTSRRGLTAVAPLSGLSGQEFRIPGYADLGVSLEYVFTRRFSLWLRGGNLLGATIQRIPLYSESGIYFTGGICLNL